MGFKSFPNRFLEHHVGHRALHDSANFLLSFSFIAVKASVLILFSVSALVPLAFGVTPLDETASPGSRALQYQKVPITWGGMKAVAFDGTITDTQSGGRYYDRRLALGGAFGFERPLVPLFGVRLDLRGEVVTRRQRMALVPETFIDETYFVGRPSADITYTTPAGLEIFGGGMLVLKPTHTQTMDAASVDAKIKYSSSALLTPRFGFTRRGGVASGGVYYVVGAEGSRKVTKSVGDGNDLKFDESLYEPTTAALFAQFTGGVMVWNLEVASISGSEGGLRAASGQTMSDDHLRIQFGGVWAGVINALIAHQTASYSKSAYMSLENIPMSSIRVGAGDPATGLWAGGVYFFGRDRQSIPEFNAKYKVDGFVILTGVNYAL